MSPAFSFRTAKTDFQLIHGDCVEQMANLPAESADLIVTSPPYNLGVVYGSYDDSSARADYLRWSVEWAAAARRILKPSGALFLNVGAAPSNPMLPYELIVELRPVFVLQNTIHWIKSITVETRDGQTISAGHFKPIQSKRFLTDCHEFVFHLTKTGDLPIDRLSIGVPYADKSNIKRWAHTGGADRRCRGNTWFIPYRTINSRDRDRPHPATFPVELAAHCIRLHGCQSDITVVDPFVGIGHSALAARDCGVGRFIGFDLDREYLETAAQALRSDSPLPHRGPDAMSGGNEILELPL